MSVTRNLIALAAVTAGLVGPASAGVVWTGSADSRAASADFSVVGSSLTITLSNTASVDAMVPIDILTGVYFDISGGAIALSRVGVVLASGSSVIDGGTDPENSVGGEWAYKGGLVGAPHSAKYGVSSSGLGLFGSGELFPGSNLSGPASPNGLQYGITTAGDNPATGNGGLLGTPIIKNSVVITLGNIGSGFDLARIGNVSFQYGTDLSEPNIPGVPTPGALGFLAVAPLLTRSRRRR